MKKIRRPDPDFRTENDLDLEHIALKRMISSGSDTYLLISTGSQKSNHIGLLSSELPNQFLGSHSIRGGLGAWPNFNGFPHRGFAGLYRNEVPVSNTVFRRHDLFSNCTSFLHRLFARKFEIQGKF